MSLPAAKVLFVYSRESSFVAIDRSVLAERWAVRDWRQQGPVVNLPAPGASGGAQRPGVRVVRLVAHVLARDARVADAQAVDRRDRRLRHRQHAGDPLRGAGPRPDAPRLALGDAARDAAAGQLQLQPRGGSRERRGRSEPRHRRAPRRPRPVRRAAAGGAGADGADGRDRRPPQRACARGWGRSCGRPPCCRMSSSCSRDGGTTAPRTSCARLQPRT